MRLYNQCIMAFTHFVTVCYVTFITFNGKLIFPTLPHTGRFSLNAAT